MLYNVGDVNVDLDVDEMDDVDDVDDVVQCGQLGQVEHRVSVTEREGQMSYDVDSKHHTIPYYWYHVDSTGARHISAFGDKIWEWGGERRREKETYV